MIPDHEILLRLVLGAFIGGIIGFEREIHGRAAGFRTQLIVCVAAVLIMVTSENYYFHIHNLDASLRIDPARISAGALIGIGFLGSGVIIKSGYAVRGLTTAASIWIVSAIGLAIGGGLYFEGLVTTAITIIALIVLRIIERRIKTLRFKKIMISAPADINVEEKIMSVLSSFNFHVHSVNYEKDRSSGEITYHFTGSTRDKKTIGQLFHELSSLDFVNTIKISG
ncbi:MAG: MgtC/SapB family protein [Nitrospirae bacterium]|nr:MgtC/SapB family protein [Nitrospirota bacterium]